MSAGDLVNIIGPSISGTVTVVMLALFIAGVIVPKSRVDEKNEELAAMKEERDEWKRAAQVNQQIANVQVQTGQVIRDVMQGLRKELDT